MPTSKQKQWVMTQPDPELPIVMLGDGFAEAADAGGLLALGGKMREFARPVVIDIGAGSKTMRLTLDQLGQGGEVLERRQVLMAYRADDSVRPSIKVIEEFIGPA